MPDDLRSLIKYRLVVHRSEPEQGIRRFYSLMIERDLFETVHLVRNCGRIGTNGQGGCHINNEYYPVLVKEASRVQENQRLGLCKN
jgi:predicted DNA-binding WGR domain protein